MKKRMSVLVLFAVVVALAAPVLAEGPDGKALFDARCAACHGKDGVAKSMAKGSANFNDQAWQKAHNADAIAKIVTEGRNKMPKFAEKLQPAEIKAVADYIKTWEKK
jgi:mono/diheme cytochrome c family protein